MRELDVERLARALERLDHGPDGAEYSHTYTVDSTEAFAAAIAAEYDSLTEADVDRRRQIIEATLAHDAERRERERWA